MQFFSNFRNKLIIYPTVKGQTHEILTKLIKIKHRRGKDKIPNNHLQPNVGITAIAIPTVKHDPIDQKNCGIHSKGSQFQVC